MPPILLRLRKYDLVSWKFHPHPNRSAELTVEALPLRGRAGLPAIALAQARRAGWERSMRIIT
jgi:hypothetical protein